METVLSNADFSVALENLKDGKQISRLGWGIREFRLSLNLDSGPRQVWLVVRGIRRMPWTFSMADILAKDWEVWSN